MPAVCVPMRGILRRDGEPESGKTQMVELEGQNGMILATAEIRLYAPWVHSLKEKRMAVKSLIAKTQNKFNVSIAEVDEQDTHQTIVLGIACVTETVSFGNSVIDKVISFIEGNTEAEIVDILREAR